MLGHDGPVTWSRDLDGLRVRLPDQRPSVVGATVRAHLAPRVRAPRQVGFYL